MLSKGLSETHHPLYQRGIIMKTIILDKKAVKNSYPTNEYSDFKLEGVKIELSSIDIGTIKRTNRFLEKNSEVRCIEIYVNAECTVADDFESEVERSTIKIYSSECYFCALEKYTNDIIEIPMDLSDL